MNPSLLPHILLTVSEPKSKDQVSVAVNQDHDEHQANSSNQTFPYHQPFNSFQHMTFTPPPSNSNQVYFQPNFGNSGYQQNWSHLAAYPYLPSASFVLPGTSMSGSADPIDSKFRFWLKRLNHMLKFVLVAVVVMRKSWMLPCLILLHFS